MKRRNPAFIILIFLFWYYSTIRERKKPLLQDIFHKVRVTNLTQGGLRAMSDLEELERARGNNEFVVTAASGSLGSLQNCEARAASNEMCTFLVMNISSLQLIPVNIIAYRSQYGSANPAAVIAPAIVATFFSTVVAVIYCKVMNRKQRV